MADIRSLRQLPQYLLYRRYGTEGTFILRYYLFDLLKLKIINIAYDGFVFSIDHACRLYDRAGFMQILSNLSDDLIGIFCNYRNLLDGFKMIRKMVNYSSCNYIYKNTQQCRIFID